MISMKFLAFEVSPGSSVKYSSDSSGLVKLTSVALSLGALKEDHATHSEYKVALCVSIGKSVKNHVVAVLDTRLHPFANLELILPSHEEIELSVVGRASVCVSGYETVEPQSEKRTASEAFGAECELEGNKMKVSALFDDIEDSEDEDYEDTKEVEESSESEDSTNSGEFDSNVDFKALSNDEASDDSDAASSSSSEEDEDDEELLKNLETARNAARRRSDASPSEQAADRKNPSVTFSCQPCKRAFKSAGGLAQHNVAKHQ